MKEGRDAGGGVGGLFEDNSDESDGSRGELNDKVGNLSKGQ